MNELPKCSTQANRVARKSHKCMGCGSAINKGDQYLYTSGVWDEPKSFKHCFNCSKVLDNYHLMDKNLSPHDGPCLDFGGVKEFLWGYVCSSWYGDLAAKEFSELFGLPLDYASLIFGDESCQP